MQMQTLSATQARNNFSDLISQVIYHRKKFFIKRKGKSVAVIVPVEVFDAKVDQKLKTKDPLNQWKDKYAKQFKDWDSIQAIRNLRDQRWTSS